MAEIRQKYRNFDDFRKSRQRLLSLALSSQSWFCPSMLIGTLQVITRCLLIIILVMLILI